MSEQVTNPIVPTSIAPDPPSTPVQALPRPTLAASVNAAQSGKVPRGLTGSNSNDLNNAARYLHLLLYSETSGFKTTTAASFGGPARTFIINTRSPEQMIPLSGHGYHIARVTDAESLLYALQFPEKAADACGFPEWKDLPDRVLQIDDMTEGSDLLVDDNSTKDDGSDVKDGRKIYAAVNDDLREVLASMKRKQMHLIITTLADISQHPFTNEETIYPKLPKGARTILTADLEFVFFIRRSSKKMLTDMTRQAYIKKDEKTGKPINSYREIFAKHKLRRDQIGRVPPIIKLEEELDLAGLWKRLSEAK